MAKKNLFYNIVILICFTIISKTLGLIRDIIISSKLGTGILNDSFIMSTKIINNLRGFFGENCISMILIPIFIKIKRYENQKSGIIFIYNIIFHLFLFSLFIMILSLFFLNSINYKNILYLSKIHYTAVPFIKIMLPYPVFNLVFALVHNLLNAMNKILILSFISLIPNVLSISIISFWNTGLLGVKMLPLTSIISVIISIIIGLFLLKNKYLSLKKEIIKLHTLFFLKKYFLIIIYSSFININLYINTWTISFFLGGLSAFYYAERILYLPISIINIIINMILIPIFSKDYVTHKSIETQNKSLEMGFFLSIPMFVIIHVLGMEIVSIIFERKIFLHQSTLKTYLILRLISINFLPSVIIKIFQIKFFSTLNVIVPLLLIIVITMINIALNYILIKNYYILGLIISNILSILMHLMFLIILSRFLFIFKFTKSTINQLIKFIIAGHAMSYIMINTKIYVLNKILLSIFIYLFLCLLLKRALKE